MDVFFLMFIGTPVLVVFLAALAVRWHERDHRKRRTEEDQRDGVSES